MPLNMSGVGKALSAAAAGFAFDGFVARKTNENERFAIKRRHGQQIFNATSENASRTKANGSAMIVVITSSKAEDSFFM